MSRAEFSQFLNGSDSTKINPLKCRSFTVQCDHFAASVWMWGFIWTTKYMDSLKVCYWIFYFPSLSFLVAKAVSNTWSELLIVSQHWPSLSLVKMTNIAGGRSYQRPLINVNSCRQAQIKLMQFPQHKQRDASCRVKQSSRSCHVSFRSRVLPVTFSFIRNSNSSAILNQALQSAGDPCLHTFCWR